MCLFVDARVLYIRSLKASTTKKKKKKLRADKHCQQRDKT